MIIAFVMVSGFAGIEATYGWGTERPLRLGPARDRPGLHGHRSTGRLLHGVTGRLVRRLGEVRVLTPGPDR